MGRRLAADGHLGAFDGDDQVACNARDHLDFGTFHKAKVFQVMLQIALPAHFDDTRGLALFQKGKRHLLDGHA